MVKRNLKRTTEAMDHLNTLVELFPDSAMAYAARASMEAEQKQYDLALFDWDEALRLQPDNADFKASKAEVEAKRKGKKGKK
jgi:tetratricopeptide (TPR) repeat protein